MYKEKRLRPYIIIGLFILLVIIIISILGIAGVFNQNPFGASTKINNFNQYYKEVPTERYDAVSAALYTTIGYNIPESEIPTQGAMIRESSITNNYNEESLSTLSTFLVDIESIQQTYQIQMQWSNNPDATMAGYSILVTCPAEDQLIYPSFKCEDMITRDPVSAFFIRYPFVNAFPITISQYDANYTTYTNYTIDYEAINNYEGIKFTISDYTGNNRDNAINELRKLGIDTTKYEIIYRDLTTEESPGRAPDDVWQFKY